ncbi:hypothetical protein [Sporosarcina newyorkensis]|uniref:Uncharacterized protein n=1 Tax=Sporosarcina newyorkensis TaxID=759851 RepID=A0A1T4XHZ5_9BACL|nr:hypothetical protein [Sporosarcina newyorkensis]SKA88741.1 hypothetical protein SAMN04244570_0733 [Sporosarcina newyorkensis]
MRISYDPLLIIGDQHIIDHAASRQARELEPVVSVYTVDEPTLQRLFNAADGSPDYFTAARYAKFKERFVEKYG